MNETISLTKQKLSSGNNVVVAGGTLALDESKLYAAKSKKFLPASPPDHTVYYTEDTGELFYGTGQNVRRISDIIILKNGATLPVTGVPNKLYVVFQDEVVTLSVWDGEKYCSIQGGNPGEAGVSLTVVDQHIAAALNNLPAATKTQVDSFYIPEDDEDRVTFTLSKKPTGGIRFYVNGARYFQDVAFSFDKQQNTVTWLYTEENEGFNLADTDVAIEYEYSVKNQSQG